MRMFHYSYCTSKPFTNQVLSTIIISDGKILFKMVLTSFRSRFDTQTYLATTRQQRRARMQRLIRAWCHARQSAGTWSWSKRRFPLLCIDGRDFTARQWILFIDGKETDGKGNEQGAPYRYKTVCELWRRLRLLTFGRSLLYVLQGIYRRGNV